LSSRAQSIALKNWRAILRKTVSQLAAFMVIAHKHNGKTLCAPLKMAKFVFSWRLILLLVELMSQKLATLSITIFPTFLKNIFTVSAVLVARALLESQFLSLLQKCVKSGVPF
jgi:hypothetical protein